MKKFFAILTLVTIAFSVNAQSIPQPHDVIYKDSIRYMVVGVDEYKCKLVEYTPVDTLNWNNITYMTHTSPWFNFDDVFSTINIYCGFGMGYNVDKHNMVSTMSFDIFGVALEIGLCGRSHGGDLSVGVWSDDKYYTCKFGFNFPVFKNVYIAPMIGMYEYQQGYTNGYDYWFDGNGNLVNSFHCTSMKTAFDYGVRISAQYEIYYMTLSGFISISNHSTTAGFGIGFKIPGLN